MYDIPTTAVSWKNDGSLSEIWPHFRSLCCWLSRSVNHIDKALSEMESKVSVPLSCPLAYHLPADVIDMAEKPNGIMAAPVISPAKWTHVGAVGRYRTALDQKDSFQQIAVDGN